MPTPVRWRGPHVQSKAPSWERAHSSPPHSYWGWHGWLLVALRTLEEQAAPLCAQ